MPLTTPLPTGFSEQIHELLPEEAPALLRALDEEPSVSIRLNARKTQELELTLPLGEAVPWARPLGYYLDQRSSFTADPLWHAGCYYVQEASSMLLSLVKPLLDKTPLTALDLCAAPGGKSTLLLDLLPEGSVLVSNELIRSRAQILAENIQKWGSTQSIVTSTEPRALGKLRSTFDFILVDAPCSGEGMLRKDEEARRQWSPGLVAQCARQQREILEDIWPALRPGGILVYSTCTFNREEDEAMIGYLVEEFGAEPLALPDCPNEITPSTLSPYPCYRMMPHRVRGEGLFLAVLRKSGDEAPAKGKPTKGKGRGSVKASAEVLTWLAEDLRQDLVLQQVGDDQLVAYSPSVSSLVEQLQALKVPILTSGIPLAEVKGKNYLPHPALALSLALAEEAFPRVEVTQETAIRYLAREAIILPEATPREFILICYQGQALGFVKHLGNRSNNLYPQAWRIRHPELVLASLAEGK
nr:RNA methyltransferase RsmF [uncultured Porphyromonas sp.]